VFVPRPKKAVAPIGESPVVDPRSARQMAGDRSL